MLFRVWKYPRDEVGEMAQADDTFSSWLLAKLSRMKVDENIFLNYVLSILEGEETRNEKLDILKSVLADCSSTVSIRSRPYGASKIAKSINSFSRSQEDEIDVHCVEILDRWQQAVSSVTNKKNVEKTVENVDQKLARLLESNVRLEETAPTCKYTDDELKIREAILSKYSHVSNGSNPGLSADNHTAVNEVIVLL